MKAFYHRDAAMLADSAKPRQDIHGLAPGLPEVNAVELGSLIDNQVFRSDSLSEHDTI
jgi:hypothetical protein